MIASVREESDRQRILSAGFDGYVSKPISISDVRHQVEQLLGGNEDGDGA